MMIIIIKYFLLSEAREKSTWVAPVRMEYPAMEEMKTQYASGPYAARGRWKEAKGTKRLPSSAMHMAAPT
jgi:hypothetical protein